MSSLPLATHESSNHVMDHSFLIRLETNCTVLCFERPSVDHVLSAAGLAPRDLRLLSSGESHDLVVDNFESFVCTDMQRTLTQPTSALDVMPKQHRGTGQP